MVVKTIRIGNKKIGEGEPCFIIAEAGVNHNGSVEIAKKLVNAAKAAGADAVKFQTFTTENLVTKDTKKAEYQGKGSQFDMLKKLELKKEDFVGLRRYCDEKEILFLSTPHTEDAIDFIDALVPLFKIGSGDLTNLQLIEKVAKKGKPVFISVGMATMDEIREAVEVIKKYKVPFIILHCTTNYPCPKKDANLNVIGVLRKEFDCPVGYSDHTEGIDIPTMAASLGAVVVEKHFTLDKNMEGPDHKASLNPLELREMVDAIRSKKKIDIPREVLGNGLKKPTKEELEFAKFVRKSVVTKKDVPTGVKITKEMLIIKRPGTGIPPKDIEKIIGKTAKHAIKKDALISWEDVE
ncbi:MAG: N-acetylneuraminate synthase [Candidatus Portnoybacteria bacterium RBG_13_40_8]|uniref:N-acetylneuraminate synthase n=1 Tax=Candidatus Portnoybacteria bacterium RBG_13_40_8 TaxID=1801990 RepID=A0A1G2F3P6_9BACT|nr:MAG: N-acetylneuraminate synthase [Candidatus Portnoybacteria bacterium RBG_13_40_8]HJX05675.1 N-acetylneuraminate synthase [Candidatus Nanoarchaeia archaeon]